MRVSGWPYRILRVYTHTQSSFRNNERAREAWGEEFWIPIEVEEKTYNLVY